MNETRNVGEIIKAVMDKEHGKEISELVPKIVKNPGMLPLEVLDQITELKTLKEGKNEIAKFFNCEFEVIKAEDSKESKAKNAIPGKPAIIVE